MLRGLDKQQEVDPGQLLRDTRTIGQRIHDFFQNPSYVGVVLLATCVAAFMLPAISDLCLIIGAGMFTYTYTRKNTLPFRLPQRSKLWDYNDLVPGGIKPNRARGITFLGNDAKTNEELWFNNEDMRTHVLIFGSTGSGKTEALVSFAYNALVQGSGFIYVDGKGDNTLYAKIFSMARTMGREDDLLLINFMTGARDIVGPQKNRLSNTLNPFSNGSSSMLSQLVISLMESSSSSSDGDMWKGRAIGFVESLMKLLVYMRDQDQLLLDANTVRNYFHLDRLEAIVMDKVFPRDKQEAVSLEGIPDVVLEPISNYLFTLPGYNKQKKGKQVSQVWEQHGFITMQLTRVFTSLADTYGHIIRTNLAEVDFKDVVLNRRILVVLLPALEKSPDELANLGKVIVASLKAMMASGLGEEVEGEYKDIIERKPTNAPTPFMCILDEYGYYAVPGFAVVPAQARSLGFSAIFAGQDLPAFQKASKEEAASIGANTNIKICMKLEDPVETWEFFTKTAGEAYVTKVDAFQTRDQSVLNNYHDSKSASFERRARIDLLDLKDQRVGEAHFFFASTIVRARTFFANPPPAKRMRLNHFLKVEAPKTRALADLLNRLGRFQEIAKGQSGEISIPTDSEDITIVAEAIHNSEFQEPIEIGVNALMAYHKRISPQMDVAEMAEPAAEDGFSIFTPLTSSEEFRANLLTDNIDLFAQPMLNRGPTLKQVSLLERMSGQSQSQANNIAAEVVRDIQVATLYPPVHTDTIEPSALADVVDEFIARIQQVRTESAEEQKKDD